MTEPEPTYTFTRSELEHLFAGIAAAIHRRDQQVANQVASVVTATIAGGLPARDQAVADAVVEALRKRSAGEQWADTPDDPAPRFVR